MGGQEFIEGDEETLALFASQAEAAIANARTYRNEQQARDDLEALIGTSSVGVEVLDARNWPGRVLQQESHHIVGDLCLPGRSLVMCRHGPPWT